MSNVVRACRVIAARLARAGVLTGLWVKRYTPGFVRWCKTSRYPRWFGRAIVYVAVATVTASIGVYLGGTSHTNVGPFNTTMSVEPSTAGESELALPPLGSLIFDSHEAPVRMSVRLDSLDPALTQELVTNPKGIRAATDSAPDELLESVVNVGVGAVAAAVLVSLIVGLVLFRNMRRAAICACLSLVMTVSVLGMAAASIRPQSIMEPRYEGLLANAPALVGDAESIADRYEKYRDQLRQFITNMSQFYTVASTLPSYEPDPDTIRALHVSDMHLNPASWDLISSIVAQFNIDVVVDTGDMTDWGSEQESDFISDGLSKLNVPYVFVRGNHDSEQTAKEIAEHENAIVLDNDVAEVAGLTVGGIGDPRFTPDRTAAPSDFREEQVLLDSGTQLADTIALDDGADLAMVHDPASAAPLADSVPLVLTGHKHQREVSELDDDTLQMVQGSSGGAGLSGLEGNEPVPLQMSVLYFDSANDNQLQAFDDISVGGHGETEVSLERHILTDGMPDEESDIIPNKEDSKQDDKGD